MTDNHINYIEFKAHDLEKIKAFIQMPLIGCSLIMDRHIPLSMKVGYRVGLKNRCGHSKRSLSCPVSPGP